MKKILLSTTGMICAIALSTAAQAGGESASSGMSKMSKGGSHSHASSAPSITLGGSIDFQAGIADQDSAFETGASSRDFKMQNDTEVHVNVEGKSDNGLTYGAVIELEADVSGDGDGEGLNADKTYIYLESGVGRVEMGNNAGAEAALKVDASSIARATGGIDGDFYDYLTIPAPMIITPDLPSQHATGVTEDATKVTYYSPRFSGVQVGVSYTPDEGDGGSAAGFTGELNGDQENVFGLGINYTGRYDDVGVQASATGAFGDSELAATEDLSAWALGLGLDFQGISVAGSWGQWDDSGLPTGSGDDSGYWTLGAAYETGPFGLSLTYLNSEAEAGTSDHEFDNLVFGADYQLAPGLVPYVEVSFYEADVAGTTVDNDGNVILVGAELSF